MPGNELSGSTANDPDSCSPRYASKKARRPTRLHPLAVENSKFCFRHGLHPRSTPACQKLRRRAPDEGLGLHPGAKFLPQKPIPEIHFCAGGIAHMSATLVGRAVLISILLTPFLAAQSNGNQSTTTCNLEDGRQVYIRYIPVPAKEKISNGKPWAPGGSPMTLFT